ncbi:peptidylprolyl isomerase [Gammaproteobacteria bacterium]|nr:peptidylprolyl isomerase [Gammaproteobacteria bacterium]
MPFPRLFDLGEFGASFPGTSLNGGRQESGLDQSFVPNIDPPLQVLMARTQRLQTRWVGMTFLFPGEWQPQFFDSVFGFTGHLLKFQLMLAAVARAFEDGSAFDRDQVKRLQQMFDGQITNAVSANASFADLLYLHFAVMRLWGLLQGLNELDDTEFMASLQTSDLASYDASGVALQVFIPLLRENPLSVLMLNGVLCDIDILGCTPLPTSTTPDLVDEAHDEADLENEHEIPVKLASLFNQPLGDDLVRMLADYCHLGMNAPFIRGPTVFGEMPDLPYIDILNRRLQFMARFIDAGFNRPDGPERHRIMMFCARFFEALVQDWMAPATHQEAERILPGVELTALPRMISLSVIRLGKPSANVKKLLYSIVRKLHGGQSFADLARIHSLDKISATAGGNLGTVMLGEIDPAFEAGVFLSDGDDNLISVETDGSIYLVQVEGREYSPRSGVLEWLLRYAVVESVDLRNGVLAMLGTLQRLIDEEAVSDRAEDDLLRLVTLARECLKMRPLLKFDHSRLEAQ